MIYIRRCKKYPSEKTGAGGGGVFILLIGCCHILSLNQTWVCYVWNRLKITKLFLLLCFVSILFSFLTPFNFFLVN